MNQEQITSLLRQILLFAGGIAVGRGWFDTVTMTALVTNVIAIIGPLMALAGSAWALYAKRPAGIVQSAADLPSTQRIITSDPAVARQTSAKVSTG